MEYPLKVTNLSKIFGSTNKQFKAVDAISFHLDHGEILGILGPNGAGKTTTMQMILSTLEMTSGTISICGYDLSTQRSKALENVGFASTYVNLQNELSVYDNFWIYGLIYGLNSKKLTAAITKWVKALNLEEIIGQKFGSLSAGQKTRVMIAKSLLHNPRLLLLDEPTASLDPDIAKLIRNLLLKLRHEENISIILTSHNMDEVSNICDRVLVLKKGSIIANDAPDKLAASVSRTRVNFVFGQNTHKAVEFLSNNKIAYSLNDRWVCIATTEKDIPSIINSIVLAGLDYQEISINAPSLEDYFIAISQS